MVRMIISLPAKDKKWLEQTGRHERVSSAEVVRRAVTHLRASQPEAGFSQAIATCAGRWKAVRTDGQAQVDALRKEWDRRP